MKSVAWLSLVEKYQNQMKILVELLGGFKKEYFKSKHAALCIYCYVYTVCSILYDMKIALCKSQIWYYSMFHGMITTVTFNHHSCWIRVWDWAFYVNMQNILNLKRSISAMKIRRTSHKLFTMSPTIQSVCILCTVETDSW